MRIKDREGCRVFHRIGYYEADVARARLFIAFIGFFAMGLGAGFHALVTIVSTRKAKRGQGGFAFLTPITTAEMARARQSIPVSRSPGATS